MKASTTWEVRSLADGLGVIGATACALHCIALPVMLVLGATVPLVFAGEEFHSRMLWLVVPAALLAFALGCKRHKDRRVLVLGALGLVGMVLAGTVLHDVVGETGEKIVTLASAGLLIAAHVRNFRLCRSEACAHEDV